MLISIQRGIPLRYVDVLVTLLCSRVGNVKPKKKQKNIQSLNPIFSYPRDTSPGRSSSSEIVHGTHVIEFRRDPFDILTGTLAPAWL